MKLKIFEKQKALKKLDDGRRKERERERARKRELNNTDAN